MDLTHFRILIHTFLNKYLVIIPEESPLVILDGNSAFCMAKDDRDTNHKRNIYRKLHFARNGKMFKIKKIDRCEGGLKLADI